MSPHRGTHTQRIPGNGAVDQNLLCHHRGASACTLEHRQVLTGNTEAHRQATDSTAGGPLVWVDGGIGVD